jgi:hypothetical protein
MIQVSPTLIRALGLALTVAYAGFTGWLYARQPQTLAQVTGGMAATVGAYRVDPVHFQEGLRFFRSEQFPEARAAFERADPAHQDAQTQFYVAYTFYRQGWGRLFHDDALYKQGMEAVDRAVALAPGGRLVVDDPGLGMRTADELKAELARGLVRDSSDWNPLKVFRPRK